MTHRFQENALEFTIIISRLKQLSIWILPHVSTQIITMFFKNLFTSIRNLMSYFTTFFASYKRSFNSLVVTLFFNRIPAAKSVIFFSIYRARRIAICCYMAISILLILMILRVSVVIAPRKIFCSIVRVSFHHFATLITRVVYCMIMICTRIEGVYN